MLSEISARMAAIVRLLAKPRLLTTNSLPSTVQTRLPSVGRSSLRTGSACCVRRVSDGRTSRNRDCSVWPFTRFFNPRKKKRDCSVWPFTKLTIRIIDLAAGMQSLEHLSQVQLRFRLRVKWQYGSGSGSHSGQNMTAPADPAPLRLCVPVHYGNI